MSAPYSIDLKVAVEQYRKRKEAKKGKQVDNSRLPAGSSMYYYCRFCGDHLATLPEGHLQMVVTVCPACKVLREHGMIDSAGNVI